MTTAAAFALAMPGLRAIDIYEQRNDLLHLQLKSRDRYLHPHIYDWPNSGTTSVEAGLPILNWRAGTAGEVASHLLSTFEAIGHDYRDHMNVYVGCPVDRVDAFPFAGCRVTVKDQPRSGGVYDIVILCVGFGFERETEKNHSYWAPHPLAGPIRSQAPSHTILVSGNGDGGLVDFLTAAFKGLSHPEICEFITNYPGIEHVTRILRDIETSAWSTDTCEIDIYDEYVKQVLPAVPHNLLLDVTDRLRPCVTVWLHTREQRLFKRESAVLNRFGAFLAIAADLNRGGDAFRILTAAEIKGDATEDTITFDTGQKVQPNYRFLRFGPDGDANLKPFTDHIQALQRSRGLIARGLRPATPPLSVSAREKFSPFTGRFGGLAEPVRNEARVSSRHVELEIRAGPGDLCTWACDLAPAEAARLWQDKVSLSLTCNVPANVAGSLRPLIARLVAHSQRSDLYCSDSLAWGPVLARYTDKALPGPDVDIRFSVSRPADRLSSPIHQVVAEPASLAAQIHAVLDLEVINLLNSQLRAGLGSPMRRSIGWTIEPALAREVLRTWGEWYERLKTHEDQRRRFLCLLSNVNDEAKPTDDWLVCIGPKIVRGHLLRATVLALAFNVAVDEPLVPTELFPGNLKAPVTTAHASGIKWLNGQMLGPEVVSHTWTTGVVLLSELRTASGLLKAGLPRLDDRPTSRPRIRDVAVHERPIIVGADDQLQSALANGRAALRDYMHSILHDRATSAAKLLEQRRPPS